MVRFALSIISFSYAREFSTVVTGWNATARTEQTKFARRFDRCKSTWITFPNLSRCFLLDDPLLLLPIELGVVIADRRQHFACVRSQQWRGARILHRRPGEDDGVADKE